MHRRLVFAFLAASLAACSQGAMSLPPASAPSFDQPSIRGAAPTLGATLNGSFLRFTTGTQATGFRIAGLLAQGMRLKVAGGTGSYTYSLTTASTAVAIKAGSTAGQFALTPKAEVNKILLKASAAPVGGGKAISATFSLQIAPLVYATNLPGSSGTALGVYAPWSLKPIVLLNESAPNAITVDSKGNVWLANGTTVEKYNATLAAHLRTISGLNAATAVAIDAAGNAYVVDGMSVKEYTPAGGSTPSRTFDSHAKITSATWVAVDSLKDVYVSDYYSSAVWVFAPGTGTTPLRKLTAGVVNPRIVAVAGNNVYVANNYPNTTIPRFPVGSSTSNGTFGTTSGLTGPSSLAVDTKGDVYVALNNVGSTVFEYTPSSLASPARKLNPVGGGNPTGLATDPLGNLYVANGGADSVDVFVPGTSTNASYSIGGTTYGPFSPSAVAVWP